MKRFHIWAQIDYSVTAVIDAETEADARREFEKLAGEESWSGTLNHDRMNSIDYIAVDEEKGVFENE